MDKDLNKTTKNSIHIFGPKHEKTHSNPTHKTYKYIWIRFITRTTDLGHDSSRFSWPSEVDLDLVLGFSWAMVIDQ